MKTLLFIFFLFASFTCKLYSQNFNFPEERKTNWSKLINHDTSSFNFTILNVLSLGLLNDSITDNSPILNNLISTYDSTIFFFPEGNYIFKSPIYLKSNIKIKGEGNNKTIFHFDINIPNHSINAIGNELNTNYFLVQNAFKNDSTLILNDVSNFNSNDWIKIYIQDSSLVNDNWAKNSIGQIINIKKISNDTLLLATSLRLDYLLNKNPIIKKIIPVKNTAIECIGIIQHANHLPNQTSNIYFNYTVNSNISGIESLGGNFSHIDLRNSSDIIVSRSYFHEAFGYGGGGQGYGITLHFTTNECLVENNIFNKLRHGVLIQAGANANIIAMNFFTNPYWNESSFPNDAAGEIVFHGNYPYLNLIEQNILNNLVFDNSHGLNGPFNTIYRNKLDLYGLFFSSNNSPSQNIIGNVITNTNFPYSLINYNIQGIDHFIYGNNNKGIVDPTGTSNLPLISLAYNNTSHINPNYYLIIGYPNTGNNVSNSARESFLNDEKNLPCKDSIFNQPINYTNELNTQNKDLSIYPNPITNYMFILANTEINCVKILDLAGKTVYQRNEKSIKNLLCIDLSLLNNGVYIIEIDNKKFKIIKI